MGKKKDKPISLEDREEELEAQHFRDESVLTEIHMDIEAKRGKIPEEQTYARVNQHVVESISNFRKHVDLAAMLRNEQYEADFASITHTMGQERKDYKKMLGDWRKSMKQLGKKWDEYVDRAYAEAMGFVSKPYPPGLMEKTASAATKPVKGTVKATKKGVDKINPLS